MPPSDSHAFLRELDKKLSTSADQNGLQKGAQASRLFLQRITAKMAVPPLLPLR